MSTSSGPHRLFGYTAEEAVGRSVTMIIPTDRHDEEPMIFERVRRDERIDHYETVRQRKDGGLVDISITVSPIKDEKGEIIGAAVPTGDHAVEVFRKDCVIPRFYDSRVVLRGAIAR